MSSIKRLLPNPVGLARKPAASTLLGSKTLLNTTSLTAPLLAPTVATPLTIRDGYPASHYYAPPVVYSPGQGLDIDIC